jgi:hypothetical protein
MNPPTSYTLLGILQGEAPDGATQEQAAAEYNKMKRQGFTERELCREMANGLAVVYEHNKWPWEVL